MTSSFDYRFVGSVKSHSPRGAEPTMAFFNRLRASIAKCGFGNSSRYAEPLIIDSNSSAVAKSASQS
jgi:hypothetical protein